ncbi:MAG: YciI family protein, partial [Pseudomonadota bacterium]
MRYTLFLYNEESSWADMSEADVQEQLGIFGAYIQDLKDAGVFVDTDWLQPSMAGTVITLKDGQRR